MKQLLLVALVAACSPTRGAPPNAPRPGTTAASTNAPPLVRPVGTAVLSLSEGAPTLVLQGPFLMTSINPGSELELAISAGACPGDLAWFEYTGGGVGVGAGQSLCVRAYGTGAKVQAFSGYDPSAAPVAPAAPAP